MNENDEWDFDEDQAQPCPECDGDGLIDDITPCPTCDGQGDAWWR